MKCKKIFALLLSLCIVMSTFVAVPVHAEGPVEFTVGSVTAEPGATITVPVSVSNNVGSGDPDYPGICCMTLNFKYNADVLTLDRKASTQGDALADLDMTKPGGTSQGDVSFVWDSTDAYEDEGVILNLVFTVAETATAGEHAIAIEVIDCADFAMDDIETSTTDGVVTIPGGESDDDEPTYDKTTFVVGDVTAAPGDEITVPVSVVNNTFGDPDYPGICCMTLNFKYDSDVLTLDRKKSTQGDALADLDMTKPGGDSQGDVNFVWDSTDAYNDEGVILNLVFTVAETATAGDYPIAVEVIDCADFAMDDIETAVINGTVTILGGESDDDEPTYDKTTFVVGDVIAVPGETITVPVSVVNNTFGDPDYPGICGMVLKFKYDADVLTLDQRATTRGNALSNLDMSMSSGISQGNVNFLWDSTDADNSEGVILNLVFTVSESATSGVYAIELNVADCVDFNWDDIETDARNGKVKVEGPIHEHTYRGVISNPATCGAVGVRTYTCACGDTYTVVIPATGIHIWDNGIVTLAPTLTSNGIRTYTCTGCGEKKTKSIPKLSETPFFSVGSITAEPGETITVPVSVANNANSGDPYEPGICCMTLNFKYDADVLALDLKNTRQGEALSTLDMTKPGSAFTQGDATFPWDSTDADNTEGVILNLVFTVSADTQPGDYPIEVVVVDCYDYWLDDIETFAFNGIVTVDSSVPAPHVHSYTEEITTPATCGKDGVKTFTCICGDTYTEVIPATGEHTYDEGVVITPATHITEGVMTYTCACGDTKTEVIPKTPDHEYDDGVITIPATCGEDGVMTYTCICGDTYTEVIPATGNHSWSDGVVTLTPTCVATGIKAYDCTVCGERKTEVIPATGIHTWHSGMIIVQPTRVTEGEWLYRCMICGEEKTEIIPAVLESDDVTNVTVSDATVRTGKEITVPVAISKNKGILGLKMTLEYNTDALTLIGATKGDALLGLEFTHSEEMGKMPVIFLWDGIEADDSNGEIVLLTFKAFEDAVPGEYKISAKIMEACDYDLNDVIVCANSGVVEVRKYTPGDIDDDGEIDTRDVVLMRRYIVNDYDVEIVEEAADVDKDGIIGIKDIILIRRYIVGGYGVELQ